MVSSVNGQEQRSVLLRQQQDALRQDLSANQASVQQNSSDKQANAADVQANSQAVEQNSQAQQSNAADIQSNNGSIQQTTGDIQTTAGNIQSTAQSISDANTRKTGVNTEISNLRSQLSSVQDDPDRAAAIQNDIQNAQMSLADLDNEIQQLETQKQQLEAQKQQQEQDLAGLQQKGQDLEQTGAQLRSEGDALQQKGTELQQTGSQLEQTGVELEQTGAQIETQIADLDSQIAQAQAEEAAQPNQAAQDDIEVWEANQEKIDALGKELADEGTVVFPKQFPTGTTAEDAAERTVSDYFKTMLNSDMYTDEQKQAFKDELAASLQDPKSVKALKKGDMETVMRDPAIRNLVKTRQDQIETLNLNNDKFKDGYIDIPSTAGEQDVAEMKEQYKSFMYKMLAAADGNVEYYKAGLAKNKSEVDMWAVTINGYNDDNVSNLESANAALHKSMRDINLNQDADAFVRELNRTNGQNNHVNTNDIAELFQDYSNNPNDPTIKTRLIKYCGYELSANRLNNDMASVQFSKDVANLLFDTATVILPGAGEVAGGAVKGGTKLLADTAKFAKYGTRLEKVGIWSSRIGKGGDHAYDLFTKFKAIYDTSK